MAETLADGGPAHAHHANLPDTKIFGEAPEAPEAPGTLEYAGNLSYAAAVGADMAGFDRVAMSGPETASKYLTNVSMFESSDYKSAYRASNRATPEREAEVLTKHFDAIAKLSGDSNFISREAIDQFVHANSARLPRGEVSALMSAALNAERIQRSNNDGWWHDSNADGSKISRADIQKYPQQERRLIDQERGMQYMADVFKNLPGDPSSHQMGLADMRNFIEQRRAANAPAGELALAEAALKTMTEHANKSGGDPEAFRLTIKNFKSVFEPRVEIDGQTYTSQQLHRRPRR